MTLDTLDNIVGPGSMLSMIIAPIRRNILLDPAFGWCSKTVPYNTTCDFYAEDVRDHLEDITVYQWGSGAFLNNTDLYISGVTPVAGGIMNLLQSRVFYNDKIFFSSPEFGIYLNDHSTEYPTTIGLNFIQSKTLFNRDV